jgi:hypothetical protein
MKLETLIENDDLTDYQKEREIEKLVLLLDETAKAVQAEKEKLIRNLDSMTDVFKRTKISATLSRYIERSINNFDTGANILEDCAHMLQDIDSPELWKIRPVDMNGGN